MVVIREETYMCYFIGILFSLSMVARIVLEETSR